MNCGGSLYNMCVCVCDYTDLWRTIYCKSIPLQMVNLFGEVLYYHKPNRHT